MVDVHIKEAGHIQVLIQSNRGDAGRKVDSTHLVEEIVQLLGVEEHFLLLGKQKREAGVEEGGYT